MRCTLVLVAAALSTLATAAHAGGPVAVLAPKGELRTAAEGGVGSGWTAEVLADPKLLAAAEKRGALDTPEGRTRLLDRIPAPVRAGKPVVVAFEAEDKKRHHSVYVFVLAPGRPAPVFERNLPLRRGRLAAPAKKQLRKDIAAALATLDEKATTPAAVVPATPPPVPTPAAPAPAAAAAPAPPPPAAAAPAAPPPVEVFPPVLEATVGGGVATRHLSYNDALSAGLRPYDLDAIPVVVGSFGIFPVARSRMRAIRGLGLVGSLRIALGLRSRAPGDETRSTSWTRVEGGVRYRLPIGASERPVVIGTTVTYGFERFRIDGANNAIDAELPSMALGFARGALDGRIPLGPVAIRGEVAGMFVVVDNAVGARFRDASAGGAEAMVGVAVPITRWFEPRLNAYYTRYFYSFSPEPGDPNVAGGALDQGLRLLAEAAFFL